eukprot:9223801-Alexandrium_andersonii.AAC.1
MAPQQKKEWHLQLIGQWPGMPTDKGPGGRRTPDKGLSPAICLSELRGRIAGRRCKSKLSPCE